MENFARKQKTVLLLCGPAGVGKTTWVRTKMDPETDSHISRDEIRFALLNDDQEYFEVENKVRNFFFDQIEKHTSDEYTDDCIFIDATHLTPKSRAQVRNHIRACPYQIAVSFEAPVEVALTRNAQRTGRALVPESAIQNMAARYEIPTLKEGFDEIWHIDAEGNIIWKECRYYE